MDSEDVRRARALTAWIFLVAAAVEVVLGAWALSGIPGGPFGNEPVTGTPFWLRAESAVSHLLPFTVTALPVAAVLLSARRVTLTAVTIQTVALVLGMVACVAAFRGTSRWADVSLAVDVAVAGAGLILTSAVLRSLSAGSLKRATAGVGNK